MKNYHQKTGGSKNVYPFDEGVYKLNYIEYSNEPKTQKPHNIHPDIIHRCNAHIQLCNSILQRHKHNVLPEPDEHVRGLLRINDRCNNMACNYDSKRGTLPVYDCACESARHK